MYNSLFFKERTDQKMGETLIVYVDILLFVNAVINSTLLYLTYKILGIKPSPLRFAGAVVISTAYGLIVCVPALSFTLNILFKIFVALLIAFVAFDFKNIIVYGKRLCIFLFVSFSYIGIITSFQYIPGAQSAFYIQNGEVYYNLPIPYLLAMTVFLCFLQKLISSFFKRKIQKDEYKTCQIVLGEKTASATCFYDTGNFLRDNLSGIPVVVIELNALSPILPESVQDCKEDTLPLLLNENDEFKSRVRIVPYRAAGGQGLLTGFRPDKFIIDGKEEKVIVGISLMVMDKEGRYNGIIGREL